MQPQFLIQMAGQPAGAPLARSAQLQLGELDPHDRLIVHLDGAVGGKQSHGSGLSLAVLKNLDRLLPRGLLLIVDLAQIKNVALNDLVTCAALVFDDAPVTVVLAIFLSRATA